jgi:hypothetical protein
MQLASMYHTNRAIFRLPAATSVLTTLVVAVSLLGCESRKTATSEPGAGIAESETGPSGTRSPDAASSAAARPEAQPVTIPDRLPMDELTAGWIALFDGHSLYGWEKGSDANWRVEQGTIVVDAGDRGLLCTTAEFADYVLQLEFRSAKGTNSGVFLRTPLQTSPDDITTKCYELNIADSDNPFPTGSLVQRQKAEGNYDSDDWQAYEVTVDGGRVAVKLDGEPVLEYTDPQPVRRGRIGLQLNEGKVEFRNLRLKPLGMTSIFNGRDLTGWKTYSAMASRFTVTDEGHLHVEDGRGQLETEQAYGDFLMQLQCKTHAPELNSGIFYRCIPGEIMNGYEAQIHNGFKDGDRTRPVDCGTGGIFRRQDARFVMADDEAWFAMTIVSNGPHVATWVNGIQVCDWTDQRPPKFNPREGLRLEPGTIMIQGHDPTTDISFRNFAIADTAP